MTSDYALHGYLAGQFSDADLLGRNDEQAAVWGVSAESKAFYQEVLAQGRDVLAETRLDWRRMGDSANRNFADEKAARAWLTATLNQLEAALQRL